MADVRDDALREARAVLTDLDRLADQLARTPDDTPDHERLLADLLLLDEPTNHLSPQLCDELEDALGGSPGAVVVASHDRWLRSRWHGREIQLRGT